MNNRFEYKHTVAQCYVADKAACEQFREKRRQWMEWLSGGDPHSIIKQIYSAIWDYALFCTVNELRRTATEIPEEGIRGQTIQTAGFFVPLERMVLEAELAGLVILDVISHGFAAVRLLLGIRLVRLFQTGPLQQRLVEHLGFFGVGRRRADRP